MGWPIRSDGSPLPRLPHWQRPIARAHAGSAESGRMSTASAVTRRPVILHVAAVEYTATALLAPQMRWLQDSGYDVRLACSAGRAAVSA